MYLTEPEVNLPKPKVIPIKPEILPKHSDLKTIYIENFLKHSWSIAENHWAELWTKTDHLIPGPTNANSISLGAWWITTYGDQNWQNWHESRHLSAIKDRSNIKSGSKVPKNGLTDFKWPVQNTKRCFSW